MPRGRPKLADNPLRNNKSANIIDDVEIRLLVTYGISQLSASTYSGR